MKLHGQGMYILQKVR